MSNDNIPLGNDERLAQLEKTGRRNRLLIFGLAGALLLNLLAWVLVVVFGNQVEMSGEETNALASLASVEALQKEVAALQLQIEPLQQQIKDQQNMILMQAKQQTESARRLAAQPKDNSREQSQENIRMVARTLIGQENNYQHTLAALKNGMQELAEMTPGSRSWLDFYTRSLNGPLADSQARVKALQNWEARQVR